MHEHLSILVVEDSQDIAEQLCDFLAAKDCIVDYASSGQSALSLIASTRYDVIVLDLMLPDTDGLAICEAIKQKTEINMPVLMLTARDSIVDKVDGFRAGADDYLTKPFALEEVYLRCLALSRRHQLHHSREIEIGDLSINLNTRKVTRCRQNIALSVTDFSILKLLAESYPKAISKRYIAEKIWGNDLPETDAVRSHVYTLRNAIDKPFNHFLVKTVHGIGFKLETQDEAEDE